MENEFFLHNILLRLGKFYYILWYYTDTKSYHARPIPFKPSVETSTFEKFRLLITIIRNITATFEFFYPAYQNPKRVLQDQHYVAFRRDLRDFVRSKI